VSAIIVAASSSKPLFPGHKSQTDPIIIDHQIPVVVTPDCAGLNFLNLLRHDADVGSVIAAFVAEAIELETIT
jgi:hypothetical protein